MIKKKAKGKKTAKKSTKKGASRKTKEMNPAEVRHEIAEMVGSEAAEMAQAVIDEGKKGQLATVKYLFEMAEIFPPATDGSQVTTDEECFAKTLMRRLDLPDTPIPLDEEDETEQVAAVKRVDEEEAHEGAKKDSNPQESQAESESADTVTV